MFQAIENGEIDENILKIALTENNFLASPQDYLQEMATDSSKDLQNK
jgi:hypothetical protein